MEKFSTDSWVDMQVRNHLTNNDDLTIANAHHNSGEFLESVNSQNPLEDEDVNNIVARPRHLAHIVACSHENDKAGTSGGYDIYDEDRKVCHVSWTCPLGRGVPNTLDIVDKDASYKIECKGASLDPGPLGHVSIRVRDSSED
jgi:hypothetical protein